VIDQLFPGISVSLERLLTKYSCDRGTSNAQKAAWNQKLGNWKLFAVAGGAAMAATTQADAGIVYEAFSPVKTVSAGNQQTITVTFKSTNQKFRMAAAGGFLSLGQTAVAQKFITAGGGLAKNLAYGDAITGNSWRYASFRKSSGAAAGNFGSSQSGFVGFYNSIMQAKGWIQVKVNSATSFSVLAYAYATNGDTITAGQTTPTAAVPEPGTMAMGLLASGAAGLVALRKAKARVAAEAGASTEPAIA